MEQEEKKDNYNGVLQKPIHSGFTDKSTAADVIRGIDLTGKMAIVTGGYAGIGLETVKTLAQAGAKVVVPARDLEKATRNLENIPDVSIESLDLMNPASIDAFAEKFLRDGSPLHILINNAGIMWVPLVRDDRGYESQLATNHLGHFQLTARLWPALKRAKGARVVSVSSFGHQMAPFHFEDPNFNDREYETLSGYGQSKTANNLFAVELDHRGKALGIRTFSVHPGSVIGTDLGRVAPMELFQKMGTHDSDGNLFPEVAKILKTIPQGAATSVWCAVSPQLSHIGGVYCENDGLPHQSAVMHLTKARLKDFYDKHKTIVTQRQSPHFITFDRHPLLKSCLASLIPYFELNEPLPDSIASIKIEEAITVLRTIDPDLDDLLGNFDEPGKAGRIDFMEQNYMFNMSMDKFGYLTGRSLTTFKRDFKKVFQTTPHKWLMEKRLELAHYQIRERRRKPSDVYLEVGFENLSHFGYLFKKRYGYAPTETRD